MPRDRRLTFRRRSKPTARPSDTLNPKHVQSYGNLALAYAGLGRRGDALACFDRALELDPDYEPAILNRRITAEMREGQPFIPDSVRQVEFYADRLRAGPHSGNPDAMGV